MTEPAHADQWTADPTLNTDALVIIGEADRLEQRSRKPAHLVSVEERMDDVMRNRLHDMFGAY